MSAMGGGRVKSKALEAGAELVTLMETQLVVKAAIGAERHVAQLQVERLARPPSHEEGSNQGSPPHSQGAVRLVERQGDNPPHDRGGERPPRCGKSPRRGREQAGKAGAGRVDEVIDGWTRYADRRVTSVDRRQVVLEATGRDGATPQNRAEVADHGRGRGWQSGDVLGRTVARKEPPMPLVAVRRDAATLRHPSTAARPVEQGDRPPAWGGCGWRNRTRRVERRDCGQEHRRVRVVKCFRPPHLGRPGRKHDHCDRAVAHDLVDDERRFGEGRADEVALAPPPILLPAVDRLRARMSRRGVEAGEVRRA